MCPFSQRAENLTVQGRAFREVAAVAADLGILHKRWHTGPYQLTGCSVTSLQVLMHAVVRGVLQLSLRLPTHSHEPVLAHL